MPQNLERALAARRESRRVEFKSGFDVTSTRDWCEVIKDVIAIANSGGGVILFGVDNVGNPTGADVSAILALDPAKFGDQLGRYVDVDFDDLDLAEFRKFSQPVVALTIGPAPTPIVFSRTGAYETPDGRQKIAFHQGTVYFRHGAKSEPGTTADLAVAIDRQLKQVRRSWLSAVRRVVHDRAPDTVLPSEIRDSESPEATPIRVTDDPRAPAYRVVDYDRTHPYRQKELLAELRRRGFAINQFDLRAVRHVHGTDAVRDFSHKPVFGSRQYSEKFLNWVQGQATSNPRFFAEGREQFQKR